MKDDNHIKVIDSFMLKHGKLSLKKSVMKNDTFYWFRWEFDDTVKKCLKDDFNIYEGVHFMPYFVSNDIENLNYGTQKPLPNIDQKSGNIHPIWEQNKVLRHLLCPKQAVLVRRVLINDKENKRWGPLKQDKEKVIKDTYDMLFNEIEDCFYPKRCECQQEITDSTLENLLVGLLRQVMDKDKLMKENNELYHIIFP